MHWQLYIEYYNHHPPKLVSWWNETFDGLMNFPTKYSQVIMFPNFKTKGQNTFALLMVITATFSFEIPPLFQRSLGPSWSVTVKYILVVIHRKSNKVAFIKTTWAGVFSTYISGYTSMIAGTFHGRTCP